MKNIKNIILSGSAVLCALLSLTNCQVTDRVPEATITDMSYWTKVEDLKLYLRTFYTSFNSYVPVTDYLDTQSDIAVPNNMSNVIFDTRTVPTGSTGWSSSDWSNIRALNYFFTHYENVSGTAEEINHYVGVACFFRAKEYYEKVKRFGDVPWYDTDLHTDDEELLYKARDPRKTVMENIVSDLEYACRNLKDPSGVASGEVHKYVAYAFLSRVCLYEACWMKYRGISGWETFMQKAADAAKAVIDSGVYSIVKVKSGYEMDDDHPLYYRSLFTQTDLTGNKECIMPMVFIENLRMNGVSRYNSVGLSKDFMEQFLCTDGLPIAKSPLYKGDKNVVDEFTNRDPRMYNMMDCAYSPWILDGSGKPTVQGKVIPGSGEPACRTGYRSIKFKSPVPAQQGYMVGDTDFAIFRYAEVLLNYAEAMEELGKCTQSVLDITINQLRDRVDMPHLTTTPEHDPLATVNGGPRYGYEISDLLYEIRRERTIELAMEGLRWDDICRWKAGKLFENPKTMLGIVVNDDVIADYTAYYGSNPFSGVTLYTINDWDGEKKLLQWYSQSSRTWNDRNYLDPLPLEQLTLNPNLTQNPGW